MGILPKNGGCAAAEHLSGGDSPLGMAAPSGRRKVREIYSLKNCCQAGQFKFFLLMVLGKLTKSGSCAATEHLSGGDSPLGMAAPSGRRKVREIYSLKNCCQAGQFKFFLLMVLGKLTKSGSCAATEHLSGGDSPLGMLGLSRRRKGRDTGGRNCSIAGTVLCFFLLELRFYVTRVQ